jgi:GNAT superfamily N-acetyltransferase
MIRQASARDRGQLRTLWQEAFGDSDAAVDYYFANRHRDRDMLVSLDGNAVTAMLTMLPVTLLYGSEARKGRYVYAVATAEQYRGRGISTDLLQYAHRVMAAENTAASLLVPAEESLFDFYRKRGYQTAFFVEDVTLPAASLPPVPPGAACAPCDAGEYLRLRDAAYADSRLYARWDENAIAYALGSERAAGNDAFSLRSPSGSGCALIARDEGNVLIKELALTGMRPAEAAAILHSVLGAAEYTLRLREGSVPGAVSRPFGMIKYLQEPPSAKGKPPYLGIVLD